MSDVPRILSQMDIATKPDHTRRKLCRATLAAWLSCGAVFLAAFWIRYAHVMHPGWQWVGITFVTTIMAGGYGLVVLARTVRERSWQIAAVWAVALVLPAMMNAAPLVYGLATKSAMRRPVAERRWLPGRQWLELSGSMGAPLLDAVGRVTYTRRTSGDHVVMLYKIAANPEADVAAMDAHVARLSALLGSPCTSRVHWVRGSLFGVSRVYFQGMSFGSDSRDEIRGPTDLDRHEVAHFVLEHLAGPRSRPPSLLQEGWAQSQMGLPAGQLACQALSAWAANPRLGPTALIGREYYDSREPIVYVQGGAFTDFLLRRYRGPRFLEMYRTCRERSFAEDCESIFGVSLAELERLYSEDLEQQALKTPDRDGLAKAPLRLLSDSGRPSMVFIWIDRRAIQRTEPSADVAAREAFFDQYPTALAKLRQLYNPITIEARTRYHRMRDGQELGRGEVLEEFAQHGRRWRARTTGETPDQIYLSSPDESVVFTSTGSTGNYSASRKLPNGVTFETEYGPHARMLPYRLGYRDISELFSDSSFVVLDIEALQVDGRGTVQLRYERMNGREQGRITFDPGRAWAVLEFQKSETYGNGPERVETYRYTYADDNAGRPVVATLYRSSKTEQRKWMSEEQTELTSVSFSHPDEQLFQRPSR
jgi:hypothetical protein